jgi:ribosome-binding factor A
MSEKKTIPQLRLQKKIEHLLQNLFSQSDFSYKDVPFNVLIVELDLTKNFRNLKVFADISHPDPKVKKEVIRKLNKESIYAIKELIAEKINLKYVPEILFILDQSNEKISKINKLLEEEKKF